VPLFYIRWRILNQSRMKRAKKRGWVIKLLDSFSSKNIRYSEDRKKQDQTVSEIPPYKGNGALGVYVELRLIVENRLPKLKGYDKIKMGVFEDYLYPKFCRAYDRLEQEGFNGISEEDKETLKSDHGKTLERIAEKISECEVKIGN